VTGTWTAVAAIAAAVAAGAAVYVGVIRPWRRRPVLRMHHPEQGRELVIVGDQRSRDDSAWVRCRVSNDPGNDAAEDVEVAIAAVREVRPREGFPPAQQTPALAGLALAWSATPDRQTRVHIAPGGERIIDVAAVYKASAASGLAPLVIRTAFEHHDAASTRELKVGEVELDLVVTARNSDSVRYRVGIAYDGEWRADVWEHLRVTRVEPIANPQRSSITAWRPSLPSRRR
jgi:hypothetical protein